MRPLALLLALPLLAACGLKGDLYLPPPKKKPAAVAPAPAPEPVPPATAPSPGDDEDTPPARPEQ